MNPWKADECKGDPTIYLLMSYAKDNGFDDGHVVNIAPKVDSKYASIHQYRNKLTLMNN